MELSMYRLRELRKGHGLTLKQIAEILGTSIQHYQKYEKDKFSLPIERLYQLADFYQVSADYILGRTDDPTPPKDAKPYVPEKKAE